MKTSILAWVGFLCAITAWLGAPAHAAATPQAMEKHLTLLETSLDGAVTNAQALTNLSHMDLGPQDQPLWDEARRDLEQNLERAQLHVSHLRKLAPKKEQARLAALARDLAQARAASEELNGSATERLDARLGPVAASLDDAQATFEAIAAQAHYTSLEDVSLERVPVSGRDLLPPPQILRNDGSYQHTPGIETGLDQPSSDFADEQTPNEFGDEGPRGIRLEEGE